MRKSLLLLALAGCSGSSAPTLDARLASEDAGMGLAAADATLIDSATDATRDPPPVDGAGDGAVVDETDSGTDGGAEASEAGGDASSDAGAIDAGPDADAASSDAGDAADAADAITLPADCSVLLTPPANVLPGFTCAEWVGCLTLEAVPGCEGPISAPGVGYDWCCP